MLKEATCWVMLSEAFFWLENHFRTKFRGAAGSFGTCVNTENKNENSAAVPLFSRASGTEEKPEHRPRRSLTR